MNNKDRYFKLVSKMKENLPGFEIKYKNESSFMEKLGKVLFFNKSFMSQYTTTIGTTIYFPNREEVEAKPEDYLYILAHECVHAWDAHNRPALFPLAYLFPQLLALLSLGAFFAFISSWFLLFLLFLIFLAPIPSPGRTWAEIRGYGMTCKIKKWMEGHVDEKYVDHITESFAGPAYYYMCPFKNYVKNKLQSYVDTDVCLKDKNPAYQYVYELVK